MIAHCVLLSTLNREAKALLFMIKIVLKVNSDTKHVTNSNVVTAINTYYSMQTVNNVFWLFKKLS